MQPSIIPQAELIVFRSHPDCIYLYFSTYIVIVDSQVYLGSIDHELLFVCVLTSLVFDVVGV